MSQKNIKYILHKLSSPGWTFESCYKPHIDRMIRAEVCDECMEDYCEEHGTPDDAAAYLATPCGYELWLEESKTE